MINKEQIKQAVTMFLEAIGEDPDRDGLRDTPDRVSRMCEELFGGYEQDAEEHLSRVFDASRPGLVIEKDIQFYSMCEHHMLPFFGKVHIAYAYDGHVVGISKLSRCVEVYARRLQIQENLTTQIAEAIYHELSAKGVMVVIEAEHMCMSMRGVKNPTSKTVTISTLGCFEDDYAMQQQVLSQLNIR